MENKEEIKSKLMLMGLNGLAYTPEWNKISKELNVEN